MWGRKNPVCALLQESGVSPSSYSQIIAATSHPSISKLFFLELLNFRYLKVLSKWELAVVVPICVTAVPKMVMPVLLGINTAQEHLLLI